MRYFFKLLNRLEDSDAIPLLDVSSLAGDQVYQALMRFHQLFSERPLEYNENDVRRFSALFQRIQSDPNVCLTPEQMECLQQLVTAYYINIQRSPVVYRKALLDCKTRQEHAGRSLCEHIGTDMQV